MNASKKSYVQPVITVVKVKVENGYGLSMDPTIVLGAEGMSEGSTLNFGVSENPGGGMLEGIGEGAIIDF